MPVESSFARSLSWLDWRASTVRESAKGRKRSGAKISIEHPSVWQSRPRAGFGPRHLCGEPAFSSPRYSGSVHLCNSKTSLSRKSLGYIEYGGRQFPERKKPGLFHSDSGEEAWLNEEAMFGHEFMRPRKSCRLVQGVAHGLRVAVGQRPNKIHRAKRCEADQDTKSSWLAVLIISGQSRCRP
jgi:hypothetical protein